MIRLSHSLDSINFSFDREGIDQFIQLFGRLFSQKNAEISEIPFVQKDGTTCAVSMTFSIGSENTLKLSKTRVHITIEQEDVDDTLERFRHARSNPEILYPEWIQVKKLSNSKNAYLYVVFREDLNTGQVI